MDEWTSWSPVTPVLRNAVLILSLSTRECPCVNFSQGVSLGTRITLRVGDATKDIESLRPNALDTTVTSKKKHQPGIDIPATFELRVAVM